METFSLACDRCGTSNKSKDKYFRCVSTSLSQYPDDIIFTICSHCRKELGDWLLHMKNMNIK